MTILPTARRTALSMLALSALCAPALAEDTAHQPWEGRWIVSASEIPLMKDRTVQISSAPGHSGSRMRVSIEVSALADGCNGLIYEAEKTPSGYALLPGRSQRLMACEMTLPDGRRVTQDDPDFPGKTGLSSVRPMLETVLSDFRLSSDGRSAAILTSQGAPITLARAETSSVRPLRDWPQQAESAAPHDQSGQPQVAVDMKVWEIGAPGANGRENRSLVSHATVVSLEGQPFPIQVTGQRAYLVRTSCTQKIGDDAVLTMSVRFQRATPGDALLGTLTLSAKEEAGEVYGNLRPPRGMTCPDSDWTTVWETKDLVLPVPETGRAAVAYNTKATAGERTLSVCQGGETGCPTAPGTRIMTFEAKPLPFPRAAETAEKTAEPAHTGRS